MSEGYITSFPSGFQGKGKWKLKSIKKAASVRNRFPHKLDNTAEKNTVSVPSFLHDEVKKEDSIPEMTSMNTGFLQRAKFPLNEAIWTNTARQGLENKLLQYRSEFRRSGFII